MHSLQSSIHFKSEVKKRSTFPKATIHLLFQSLEATVIQKFVKSNGPKAFICRTVWRKDKNPFCWIITNKADYYSEEKLPEA